MLDLPTLVAGQAILTVVYAGIFYGVHRIYPELRGIRYLVAGFMLVTVARIFFMPHNEYANIFANLLALAASVLLYTATLRHLGSSRSTRGVCFIAGFFGLAIVLCKVFSLNPAIHYVLEASAFLFLRVVWSKELFRHATGRPLLRTFAIFMAIYASFAPNILLVRLPVLSVPVSHLVRPLPLEATLLVVNVALSALMGLFLLLMVGSSIIEQLRQQSVTDPVTGRLNRRGIEQKIAAEIAQSARGSHICSIALIDLDYFKSINDHFGHAVGDDTLRHAAEVILATVRPYDCLGRVGGDEFVLVLPSSNGESAVKVAERVCNAIRNESEENRPHLSTSIGVAQYEFKDTAASFLERADAALYRAKEAGRGCVRFQTLPTPTPDQLPSQSI